MLSKAELGVLIRLLDSSYFELTVPFSYQYLSNISPLADATMAVCSIVVMPPSQQPVFSLLLAVRVDSNKRTELVQETGFCSGMLLEGFLENCASGKHFGTTFC